MNRVMKDSGIEWIGNIPQEWEIIKNKYVFKRRNNKVAENYINYQLLSLTKKGIVEKNLNETGGKLPASFSTYQEVQKDDIVLCLFDLDVSAVFSSISKYHGMISSAYDIFKTNQDSIPDYYDYLFQIIGFDRLYLPFSKSLRKTINKENFNSIYTIKPPYNEQIKIVDFLNKSTMNINNIITQTHQSIEELKKYKQSLIAESVTKGIDPNVEMKDSGIEWIGAIPSRWGLNQIKTVAKVMNGKEIETDGGHIPVFGSGGVFKYTNTKLYDRESVLFGRKGTIGKPLIVNQPFWTVDTMFYTHIFENRAFPKWLYYILISLPWDVYSTQTTIPSIVGSEIESIRIPVPAIEEQQQIAEYLDDKATTIDKLIENKIKIIEELENYKKSLIYEYVTGKKEV